MKMTLSNKVISDYKFFVRHIQASETRIRQNYEKL